MPSLQSPKKPEPNLSIRVNPLLVLHTHKVTIPFIHPRKDPQILTLAFLIYCGLLIFRDLSSIRVICVHISLDGLLGRYTTYVEEAKMPSCQFYNFQDVPRYPDGFPFDRS